MGVHIDHEALVAGIAEQQRAILDHSEQAVYIYLDDVHKVCNQKFAAMLGFDSPQQWTSVQDGFTMAFVDEGSQRALVSAYQSAMTQLVGSSIEVVWKTRSGERVPTHVVLVPIVYEGQLLAMHFIS